MAFKTKYSKGILINFALFIAVHLLAFITGFYYIAKGFDKVMHLWGGVSVAMFFVWFFYYSGRFNEPISRHWIFFLLLIVGCVALVGVGWELYEYVVNNYIPSSRGMMQGDVTDTMGDLLSDLVGGAIVGICFIKKIKSKDVTGN